MDFSKVTNFIKSNLAINRIELSKGIAGRALKEGQEGFEMVKKSQNKEDIVNILKSRKPLEDIVNGKVKTDKDAVNNLIKHNTMKIQNSKYGDLKDNIIAGGAHSLTYGQLAKEYFWSGANGTQKAMRIGTVAGGWMGANIALRGLSGGNPIRNNLGENDIAGIPFI